MDSIKWQRSIKARTTRKPWRKATLQDICVDLTGWVSEGHKRKSQEARRASSPKSGPGGPPDFYFDCWSSEEANNSGDSLRDLIQADTWRPRQRDTRQEPPTRTCCLCHCQYLCLLSLSKIWHIVKLIHGGLDKEIQDKNHPQEHVLFVFDIVFVFCLCQKPNTSWKIVPSPGKEIQDKSYPQEYAVFVIVNVFVFVKNLIHGGQQRQTSQNTKKKATHKRQLSLWLSLSLSKT